jgi:hypothetical protein
MILCQTTPAKTEFKSIDEVVSWAKSEGFEYVRSNNSVKVTYTVRDYDDNECGEETMRYWFRPKTVKLQTKRSKKK